MPATATAKEERKPAPARRKPEIVVVQPTTTVEELLDDTVNRIQKSRRSDVLLRKEAENIVAILEEQAPQELLDYFRTHAVELLREKLQLRLAAIRTRERRSVFGGEPGRGERDIEDVPRVNPFSVRYAIQGNIWRPLGDMLRADWEYIASNRADTAVNSLFEIELAKRMVARLPDETTLTKEVVSEDELEKLTRLARKRAEQTVSRFQS
jgi:hypothetical protein